MLFDSVYFRFNFASCSVYTCKITEYSVSYNSNYGIFRIETVLKIVTLLIMTDLELKELRRKLDLTQVQLAKLIGVDVKTIQNWESGRKIPRSKDGILQSLTARPHVVFGGQHVQNGDAVNGDKIVEEVADAKDSVEEVVKEDVNIKKIVACEADRLMSLLEAKQKSIDSLIAQQARYLTIIENLSNPK